MTEPTMVAEDEVFTFPLQQLLNALPFKDETYFIQNPHVDATDPDVCFARQVLDIIDTHFADTLERATAFKKSFCGTEQNGVCVSLEFSLGDDGGSSSRGLVLFVASISAEGKKLVFTPHYILTGYILHDKDTGVELFHPSDAVVDMDTTGSAALFERAECVEDFFQTLCFAEEAARHICAGFPVDLRQHQAWVCNTDPNELEKRTYRICTRGNDGFSAEIRDMQAFSSTTMIPDATGPYMN